MTQDGTKLGIALLVFLLLMFWIASAYTTEKTPETVENKKFELYKKCVNVLFINNRADQIVNCEYIKK